MIEPETDSEAEGLVYSYRPRAIGSGIAFRLGEHSLEWNMGGGLGRAAYAMITRVRLGYRPSNFGNRRFIAEIWTQNGARVDIASASYRSVVAMDDQGPAYRAFIEELHRRIIAASANCRFDAGFAAWRWWPMVAVAVVTAAVLLYVGVTTLASGDFGAGSLIFGFIALFVWQMLPLITRNRPHSYDPLHIPPEVMP